MTIKHTPINHEYLKYINANAFLTAKDIMNIFGYSDTSGVRKAMYRGDIPMYEKREKGIRISRCFWKASDIIKKINEINNG